MSSFKIYAIYFSRTATLTTLLNGRWRTRSNHVGRRSDGIPGTNVVASSVCTPVYIRLSYLGRVSEEYRRRISQTISRTYDGLTLRTIFTSKSNFPVAVKDVLPALHRSKVIYQFQCRCGNTYVGRTTQQLQARIRQYVPEKVRAALGKLNSPPTTTPDSAIAQYLLSEPSCGKAYSDAQFSIIDQGRNDFHLSILEAIHIMSRESILCRQKKFVYTTTLF